MSQLFINSLSNWGVAGLKDECRRQGLESTGGKVVLLQRLQTFYENKFASQDVGQGQQFQPSAESDNTEESTTAKEPEVTETADLIHLHSEEVPLTTSQVLEDKRRQSLSPQTLPSALRATANVSDLASSSMTDDTTQNVSSSSRESMSTSAEHTTRGSNVHFPSVHFAGLLPNSVSELTTAFTTPTYSYYGARPKMSSLVEQSPWENDCRLDLYRQANATVGTSMVDSRLHLYGQTNVSVGTSMVGLRYRYVQQQVSS